LLDDLSKQYETGRRGRTKEERIEEPIVGSSIENVLTKTAKKVNVSKNTVQRARSFVKAVKNNPSKYKGKKITYVLKAEKEERDKKGSLFFFLYYQQSSFMNE